MTREDQVALRRRYAERMTAALPGADPRLTDALAAVPREAFAGPPPWTVLDGAGWPRTTHDPADLYQDVLIVLDADKRLNNGSPSLHARMLHLLDVRPGARVLHVGTGGGYYTALLAELTGEDGVIAAVEFDPTLARAARGNLVPWPWVGVEEGDGAAFPRTPVDRIYVNCAVADLPDAWLDGLAPGGRLLAPFGAPRPDAVGGARGSSDRAAILTITRTDQGYDAAFDIAVAFVMAGGMAAGDTATQAAVHAALGRGSLGAVRWLRRGQVAGAWLATGRWSLVEG